ncbi:MAG TPA: anti-sigma regulatory factor [Jiangellales bacterium]|nr:anti-sigma regulatory factor [Jiangellales bacterium]
MSDDTTPAGQDQRAGERVELRLPADSAYLAVLRTAAAGLAARLDFTLDEIEDLRIAVDEACALLLPRIAEGDGLTCVFTIEADTLGVEVSARTTDADPPRRDSFAWTVLTALAGEVDASADGDGRVRITLRKRRGAVVGA